MTDQACRERVRWMASHVGLEVFFVSPVELDTELETGTLGAVFMLADLDSELEQFALPTVTDDEIRSGIERARIGLAQRCGCEIVHDGAGVFRCLRHEVECDTGEEQDPVIRQTLRWTAECPVGGVSQAFYLMGHKPPESK
ncbi:MAG TPA: hypothetical protein VN515_05690 [Terriglobales bacterium]|nr:hypothetical protein [Terriglobales bacterium]